MTHDRLVFIIRLTPYRKKPARTTAVTCEVDDAEVERYSGGNKKKATFWSRRELR